MYAAGPALRLLVTIVQIAALLAFALAAPAAHAHPAQPSQNHAQSHAQSHDCAGHHGAVAQAVTAEAGQAAQDGAPACCVHACCHHVFAAASDGPVQPLRWARPARLVPEPAAALPGVTPEAFPKPPRTRA